MPDWVDCKIIGERPKTFLVRIDSLENVADRVQTLKKSRVRLKHKQPELPVTKCYNCAHYECLPK